MKLSLYLLILICIPLLWKKNDIKDYVKEQLHVVSSINPEDTTSFEDLHAIGDAIGNAGVVMLGEQCHLDGATFAAKSRLIKYLHKHKGFNVLAFESDFFTLNAANQVHSETIEEEYQRKKKGVNNIWTGMEECHSLFNSYIPSSLRSSHPLRLTGFDNQFYSLFGDSTLKVFLKAAFDKGHLNSGLNEKPNEKFYVALDSLTSSVFKSREQLLHPSDEFTSLMNEFGVLLSKIVADADSSTENSFEMQVVKNIRAFNDQVLHFNDREFDSLRDSMMADNLHWLMTEKFPNEKIIVWAANSHINKKPGGITSPFTAMGHFFLEKIPDSEIYSLAFTSREGYHGRSESIKISRPLSKDLEKWIPDDVDYAFLNWKNETSLADERFYMRALGHGNIKRNWQTRFDGVFYIKEMQPAHRLNDKTKGLGHE